MTDQTPPTIEKAARRVVDSTLAIAFARFFMPIALAVIGWLMVNTVDDMKAQIKDGNLAVWSAVKSVQTTVNGQTTDIAVLKQSQGSAERALDRLTSIVDKLNSK